jgi:hypothetical protein
MLAFALEVRPFPVEELSLAFRAQEAIRRFHSSRLGQSLTQCGRVLPRLKIQPKVVLFIVA